MSVNGVRCSETSQRREEMARPMIGDVALAKQAPSTLGLADALATGFGEEPRAPLCFVDPVLDHARRCDVSVRSADSVRG